MHDSNMATIYRAIINSGGRQSDRYTPGFVLETRAGEVGLARAQERFAALLRQHAPAGDDARAWLEVTSRTGLRETLARFAGKVLARDRISCAVTNSVWVEDKSA